jgi:methyl-accepting chemotaxis protein
MEKISQSNEAVKTIYENTELESQSAGDVIVTMERSQSISSKNMQHSQSLENLANELSRGISMLNKLLIQFKTE